METLRRRIPLTFTVEAPHLGLRRGVPASRMGVRTIFQSTRRAQCREMEDLGYRDRKGFRRCLRRRTPTRHKMSSHGFARFGVTTQNQNLVDSVAFWSAAAPAYRWIELINNRALSGAPLTPYAHRVYTYVAMAMYDATVATWDSKYTYNRPRPSEL